MRIAGSRGLLEITGGRNHAAVVLTEGLHSLLALGTLAGKGLIDRLAKRIPEFLLLPPVDGHLLGFMLPALLQSAHRVDSQRALRAQFLRLLDERAPALQAELASRAQRGLGLIEQGLPLRLHFGKRLFTEVTGFAPALLERLHGARTRLPVAALALALGPVAQLVHQGAALGAGGLLLLTRFFKPNLNDLVRLVAGLVKALPQAMVGHTALIARLPLLAHLAQGLLLFAPAQRLLDQALGLEQQVLADLIGPPALPAFELAGGRQRRMGLRLQGAIDQADMFLERLPEIDRGLGRGLAVAFGKLVLQGLERLSNGSPGLRLLLGQHGRIDLGAHRLVAFLGRAVSTRGAQLVGPDRHGRQCSAVVIGRGHGLCQRGLKSGPHRQQLGARRLDVQRKARIGAGPDRITDQGIGLRLPLGHIGAQPGPRGLGLAPALGRKHLGALRNQHRRLALNLRAMLQVFNGLDSLGQQALEAGQRLARQRRARLGRIALPGQCIGQVEPAGVQQGLPLGGPVGGQGVLAARAPELVELLAQRPRRPLVAVGQLAKDLCHALGRRVAGQPGAHARGPLARCGGGKSAAGQRIELLDVGRLAAGLGVVCGVGMDHVVVAG